MAHARAAAAGSKAAALVRAQRTTKGVRVCAKLQHCTLGSSVCPAGAAATAYAAAQQLRQAALRIKRALLLFIAASLHSMLTY
jgi:hypothetical protein